MKTIEEKLKYWKGELDAYHISPADFIREIRVIEKFISDLQELQKEDIVSKDDKWVKELEKLPALDENNNPIKEDTVTPLQDEEIEKLAEKASLIKKGDTYTQYSIEWRQGFVTGYKAMFSALKEDAVGEKTLQQKMDEYFDKVSPEDLIKKFEAKGYTFKATEDTVQPTDSITLIEELEKRGVVLSEENLTHAKWLKQFLQSQNKPNAVQPIEKGNYTNHFINWRNRFFDYEVKVLEYKSKHNGNRYSIDELHKAYTRAMLNSPFQSQTKTEDRCNCLFGNPNIAGATDNCPIHKQDNKQKHGFFCTCSKCELKRNSEQTKPVEGGAVKLLRELLEQYESILTDLYKRNNMNLEQ